MSELSKRHEEEISKKLYAIVEQEIGGASYLAEKFEAVLRDSLPALKKQWEREATLAEHKSHVDFENELYATLVDPVAEGSIKEAEMRKQLLESARWYRQHVHDLETQLNQLRSSK